MCWDPGSHVKDFLFLCHKKKTCGFYAEQFCLLAYPKCLGTVLDTQYSRTFDVINYLE